MAGYEPVEWAETDSADVFTFEGQSRPQTGKSTVSYVAQVTARPRGLSLRLPVHRSPVHRCPNHRCPNHRCPRERIPRSQKLIRHADRIAAANLWLTTNTHWLCRTKIFNEWCGMCTLVCNDGMGPFNSGKISAGDSAAVSTKTFQREPVANTGITNSRS